MIAITRNGSGSIARSGRIIIDFYAFHVGFGGPGPIPLDVGRNSVQKFANIGPRSLMVTHFGSLYNFGKIMTCTAM